MNTPKKYEPSNLPEQLEDLWLWPFGWWKSATEAWLSASTQLLGGASIHEVGKNLAPHLHTPIDPWAVLKLWIPQVDAVIEPEQGTDSAYTDSGALLRMWLQLPAWGLFPITAEVNRAAQKQGKAGGISPAPEDTKAAAPAVSAPFATAPAISAPVQKKAPARRPATKKTATAVSPSAATSATQPAAESGKTPAETPVKPAPRRRTPAAKVVPKSGA